MLSTVDSDVLVLAVSSVVLLENTELWVAFGTGKHLRYIPAHDIATILGGEKAHALPMFHPFTGCNTVSSFAGRGKKTAFDIWKSINEVTAVLSTLSTNPWSFNDDFMCILETYVVFLYNRTCTETTADSGRKYILCSKAGQSKPYHPQEQHCFNTRNWLYTKVDMCGDKHMSILHNFLRQMPAGGCVQEFHANLGAAVDIVSRSSAIVFRIVTLRVAESVKRTVQMCQSFSKMHIAVPVQWQLRSQRRQLSYMFQNDMHRTVSCKLQVYIEIG